MNSFNVQNIIEGQALAISVTGMAIVFSGLIFISLYIALLPRILEFLSSFPQKDKAVSEQAQKPELDTVQKKEAPVDSPLPTAAVAEDDESNDIASVIGLVLQLEQERLAKKNNEQITLSRNSQQASMWGKAGRMRKLPQRRTHA